MDFKLTSCQARNTFPLMRLLSEYLENKMDLNVSYVHDAPWQDRSRWLHAGDIQLGWICSKPYALQLDANPRLLEGIAVPIMKGDLYAGQPVYYSYLVVHKDNPAVSIYDLKNGSVAYNEPGSQSGYFSLLTGLAEIGETADYFSQWLESGAHKYSLGWLQTKRVDAAAIDSTLWDYESSLDPQRFADLKIIGLLGPFPGPPLAAHFSVPTEMRDQLRQILAELHLTPEGRAILDASHISHFESVSDPLYRQLAHVKLPTPKI
ncbi:MAG: PhnD/SsuA/transferrin family substrate-binding protein [Chloroflexota bacterium]